MELFSKRNQKWIRFRVIRRDNGRKPGELIKSPLRNRLKQELKYAIQSNEYLENFLIVHNQRKENFYLHKKTLTDLTLRELGYNISSTIDLDGFEFKKDDARDDRFFDLIELLIIFCKKEKRENFIKRLKTIFKEEGSDFSIHSFMIFKGGSTDLRSIIPLIKEKPLHKKLKSFYTQSYNNENYEFLARTSADIIQLLTSSPQSKKKTKGYATSLCKKVAKEWTDESKAEDLANLLSETIKNAKKLSNQISNVRHTDRTTIPVGSPNFYKLIAQKNIQLVELIILSLPESYIIQKNPEDLKNNYLQSYRVEKDNVWLVKKRDQGDSIDVKDIPF